MGEPSSRKRTRIVAIVLSGAALAAALFLVWRTNRYVGPTGPRNNLYREMSRTMGSIETGQKNAFQQETEVDGGAEPKYVHTFCPSMHCLKITPPDPSRCQYSVDSNGKADAEARWSAHAICDLGDGDGPMEMWIAGKGTATGDAERTEWRVTGD